MDKWLIVLFLLTICSALLSFVDILIEGNVDTANASIAVHLALTALALSVALFYLCLLTTFIFRLWITFEDSVWAMSTRIRNVFIALYLLFVPFLCIGYVAYFQSYAHGELSLAWQFTLLAGSLVYVCASTLAAYLFIRNLWRMAV